MGEELIFPDPDKPLNKQQILALGGQLVESIYDVSEENPKLATYVVPYLYYLDIYQDKHKLLKEVDEFWKIFKLVKDEYTRLHVRPYEDKLDKFVFVKGSNGIVGGLFWRKVPRSKYERVLEQGEVLKKMAEQYWLEKWRAKRRGRAFEEVLTEHRIKVDTRTLTEFAKAIAKEIAAAIKTELGAVKGVPVKAEPAVYVAKPPTQIDVVASALREIEGIYKIEYFPARKELCVTGRLDVADAIRATLRMFGFEVTSERIVGHLVIVCGRLVKE